MSVFIGLVNDVISIIHKMFVAIFAFPEGFLDAAVRAELPLENDEGDEKENNAAGEAGQEQRAMRLPQERPAQRQQDQNPQAEDERNYFIFLYSLHFQIRGAASGHRTCKSLQT